MNTEHKDWNHNCSGAGCQMTGCENRQAAEDIAALGRVEVERERTRKRIICGQPAVLVGTDPSGPWVREDGTRWWFCAGAYCGGLRWKASNTPHPTTCTRPPRTSDAADAATKEQVLFAGTERELQSRMAHAGGDRDRHKVRRFIFKCTDGTEFFAVAPHESGALAVLAAERPGMSATFVCALPEYGNATMIEGLIHHARLVNKITGWTTTDDVRELARALENAGHILADHVEQQR